jgi:hypothetical protein
VRGLAMRLPKAQGLGAVRKAAPQTPPLVPSGL